MTLRKRTLALLLTVCLLLSVAVPMVSAADLFIKVQLGKNYSANYDFIANPGNVADLGKEADGTGYAYMKFRKTDAEVGNWVAIRINNTDAFAAGEYHLNLNISKINNAEEKGGKADVYLLADTDKTGADLESYITAGLTDSNYLFQASSIESDVGLKDCGVVTVGESFILVFKSAAGQTPQNGVDCYVRLAQVNLVPIQTAGDADSLAAALTTIADTAKGRYCTIKLTADFTAGDVVIPANVTLDTNGHTLTVDSYDNQGKEVGNGSVQIAGQTPPAGGEGGGTVTPPAGGEGGGTVTPPAGGEGGGTNTPPQTGDASPVLFAVVALVASLLAMVALIPNKKRA